MDFYQITKKFVSKYKDNVLPDFKVGKSKDFMVQGKSFYAIWNESTGLWSKNEFDVVRIVDSDIKNYIDEHENEGSVLEPLYMSSYSSMSWRRYKNFIKDMPDNYVQLDTKVTFENTPVKKTDYVSRRLPYAMEEGSIECYDKIMSTLYDSEQREKIEWAIGSIISGDSKKIQKFIGLYGGPGTGKSTVLNIIEALFEGYCVSFDAKELVSGNNAFAGDAFATNPLVAIQHDGNLSRITDNSLLNTIVSHEKLTINEKFKSKFEIRLNTFLFMATNEPFKITNLNSGLSRRLIDVHPSGRLVDTSEYYILMDKLMAEELGHIAYHCFNVYKERGKSYYSNYKPIEMMYKTDPFFNFVQEYIMTDHNVASNDCISLGAAYDIYKSYVKTEEVPHPLLRHQVRENLKDYFETFIQGQHRDDNGERVGSSTFYGFKYDLFDVNVIKPKKKDVKEYNWLDLKEQHSNLDDLMADFPAQYTRVDAKSGNRVPKVKWDKVTTKLKDLDTSDYHFINCPIEHIVIDFDIRGTDGEKNAEMNLEAAKELPPTYAELSQGGAGLHLHYIYDGDPNELARVYDDNVEIKVYSGDQAIRRRLTKCNNLKVAHISAGDLPVRETKKVLDFEGYKNEKALRTAIDNNLQKKNVPGTKPSVEFILKDLDRAYESGMHYDVTDLRPEIMAFAANSTHHSELCLEMVGKMKFRSEEAKEDFTTKDYDELPIAFFDVEVFPNLFVLVYKLQGKENDCVTMINPDPKLVENFYKKYRIIGYNNREYDNHIIYAWTQGYTNYELYCLSKRIIEKSPNSKIASAYNISYTDIYDYSFEKKKLKKWEIDLGIHHMELGLPWDEPVPKKLWDKVAEYCSYDVLATEATFDATQSDFKARCILADIAGGTPNQSTNQLTLKLVFGSEKKPELVYTDLATGKQSVGR